MSGSKKYINEDESEIVKMMVAHFMRSFREVAAMMVLSPTKGAHLFNLAIVSFLETAAINLDEVHNTFKKDKDYTPLNMHGKTFDKHRELFLHLLQHGKMVRMDDE